MRICVVGLHGVWEEFFLMATSGITGRMEDLMHGNGSLGELTPLSWLHDKMDNTIPKSSVLLFCRM